MKNIAVKTSHKNYSVLPFVLIGMNMLVVEHSKPVPIAVLVYEELSDIKRNCIFIAAVSDVRQFSCFIKYIKLMSRLLQNNINIRGICF